MGRHWKLSDAAGKSTVISAHGGLKSEISDVYVSVICRTFGLDERAFRGPLPAESDRKVASAAGWLGTSLTITRRSTGRPLVEPAPCSRTTGLRSATRNIR